LLEIVRRSALAAQEDAAHKAEKKSRPAAEEQA
jgi:hypothetical protein